MTLATPLFPSIQIAVIIERDEATATAMTAILQSEGFRVLVLSEVPSVSKLGWLRPELTVVGYPQSGESAIAPFLTAMERDAAQAVPVMLLGDGLRDVCRQEPYLRSVVRTFLSVPSRIGAPPFDLNYSSI